MIDDKYKMMEREGDDFLAIYRPKEEKKITKKKDKTMSIIAIIFCISFVMLISGIVMTIISSNKQAEECQSKGGVYASSKYGSVCYNKDVVIELKD